jgi:glycosyltransferase involved in cell wall biosynthesis
MRILVNSVVYPNIGGVATVTQLLANEWVNAGEEVIVAANVQHTPQGSQTLPYQVYYRPSLLKWIALMRWCDVYLQFNVSLRTIWPLLLIRRPLIVGHHGYYWLSRNGAMGWRDRLKLRVASSSFNIFICKTIAKEFDEKGAVIYNPFDEDIFFSDGATLRDTELAFVGRLVSDKGADCLIQALSTLKKKMIAPRLSIIGAGPERPSLESLCSELDLRDQVRFLGMKSQSEVSELLRRHVILVIPSLVAEGYPVTALEGIASGCVIVGSDQGGLPEAIGPCGLTFPNGDAAALAERLETLLTDRGAVSSLLEGAESHLAKHRPAFVANRYLEVIRQVLS